MLDARIARSATLRRGAALYLARRFWKRFADDGSFVLFDPTSRDQDAANRAMLLYQGSRLDPRRLPR